MLAQEIIRTKRDGSRLGAPAIGSFVQGICDGSWSEGQIAALAMAILLRGMDRRETAELTRAMSQSGQRMDWDDLPGPVVDKHSTGGIGDKVSLILAPVLAACGCYVPMLSGRGLGHTGGTLDKLDAIPGYQTSASVEQVRHTVKEAGCAIVGQTADLAPADRRLYAIRDVTGTVESMELITASILSKKLAAGPRHLVMDVKIGSGAFMTDRAAGCALAKSLVKVATEAGLPTRALVTDMNMCLGHSAGNALEVQEAIDILLGHARPDRLVRITLALAGELLDMSGIGSGQEKAAAVLSDGRAAECFGRMVTLMGGPHDLLDRPAHYLGQAPVCRVVKAKATGYVTAIDGRAIGLAIINLGGGRRHAEHDIHHGVGLSQLIETGSAVDPDTPLGFVHADSEGAADVAEAELRRAYDLGDEPPEVMPLILDRIA